VPPTKEDMLHTAALARQRGESPVKRVRILQQVYDNLPLVEAGKIVNEEREISVCIGGGC
jgi:hypothetical protein